MLRVAIMSNLKVKYKNIHNINEGLQYINKILRLHLQMTSVSISDYWIEIYDDYSDRWYEIDNSDEIISSYIISD